MTTAYSQYLSSLADRVIALRSGLAASAVVGAVALGVVTVGTAAVSVTTAGPFAAAAQGRPAEAPPAAYAGKAEHVGKAPQVAKAESAPSLATAAAVIGLAEQQVGIKADPTGQTKFQAWYASTPDARLTAERDGGRPQDYNRAEWCDMFVSWVGAKAGAKDMGRDAYTVDHAKWFQKIGRWGDKPIPGAVVFYSWTGGGTDGIDHVGLVVKDNGDGTITTIEGNTTGDAVAKKVRPTTQVVGYGYPEYIRT